MNKPITQAELEQHIQAAPSDADAANTRRKKLRKKLLAGLAATVVISGAGYYAYEELFGSRYVTTDNAYVGADTAQVTPLIGAPVEAVFASDTNSVARGDVLIQLDDTDARIAVAQAEAALGQAERRVGGYFANDEALTAQVAARAADQARAAADVASAEIDPPARAHRFRAAQGTGCVRLRVGRRVDLCRECVAHGGGRARSGARQPDPGSGHS